jgi:hypothetical protein
MSSEGKTMHILTDPDEYEMVYYSKVCTACSGDLRKCNGMCNGSAGYSMVRRPDEEIRIIKARRRTESEDAILAEADAIRARRS